MNFGVYMYYALGMLLLESEFTSRNLLVKKFMGRNLLINKFHE